MTVRIQMSLNKAVLPTYLVGKTFCLFRPNTHVCKKVITFAGCKMKAKDSEQCVEITGEKCLGEESFKTATSSSPDTCITSTLSCVCEDEQILNGDFRMDNCQGLPELTFAMIKPDGMKYIKSIEQRMKNEGFYIVQSRKVQLSPEQASNFYHEHYGRPYFPYLVSTMCEGPIQAYVLRGKDAVIMWRILCGPPCVDQAKKLYPDSIRAIYGTPGQSFKNVCHSSASQEKAKEEIRFFFPSMVLDDNFQKQNEVEDYIQELVNPTLFEGLIQLCKNKPLDPIVWLAVWLLKNNPFKPKMAESVTLTPT